MMREYSELEKRLASKVVEWMEIWEENRPEGVRRKTVPSVEQLLEDTEKTP